ncbi:MAG: AAA family ATPase, partial [Parcubacteria group bacterium]|nr:AAA family ATPase [Parcubacteria group bacterium]
MIIKSIRLENIRSYVDEEIKFPEGKVLLSGDIGSGKSSILLAMEFALFGLAKGSSNGSGLLRNGVDKGSVELNFEIDGRNVMIKRGLKRASGILQDYGSLIIDGKEIQLTVLELRQKVLDMLSYPRELLTKSKSLIYRYTVYTPQEEMKAILQEGNDLRLDTLRKVFGIDKYKRIRDNAKIFVDEMKARKREMSSEILDLDAKRIEKNEINERLTSTRENASKIGRELENVNAEIMYKKEWMNKLESEVKRYNEIMSMMAVNDARSKAARDRLEEASREGIEIQTEIHSIMDDFGNFDFDNSRKILQERSSEIEVISKRINEIYGKIGEARLIASNASSNKSRMIQIDECPYCRQNVSHEHKAKIIGEEDKRILDANRMEAAYKNEKDALDKKYNEIKDDVNMLNGKINSYLLAVNRLDDRKKSIQKNNEIIKNAERELAGLNVEKSMHKDSLASFKESEHSYQKEKAVMDILLESQKKLVARQASINADAKMIEEIIGRIMEEIKRKEEISSRIESMDMIRGWIEQDFFNLIESMERSVMLRIYGEFDSIFRKWVEMLVNDGNLRIRLDEEFSPKIEQNGHDIEYEYLSGGEKTAVALAYRLALNQVINSIISQVKTKEIIILDEPTDGFS